ncbi:MAG: cytidine deaminase [Gemmatimonadaceae bacterium]
MKRDAAADGALRAAAEQAMLHAYAPYSNFRVGAAVQSGDGRIFTGANVENASYGLAMCAERTAIGAAVAAGARGFVTLALVSDAEGPASPCGACRQVLAEFAPDLRITSYGLKGEVAEWTVAELLPHQFRLNEGNETHE